MPETPEELYERAAGALRMPPVEEWETFPFDGEMRPRALLPPEERERPRFGEGGVDCRRCAAPDDEYLWVNERWRLWSFDKPTGLPLIVLLEPRAHYAEPGDLPDDVAADLGVMLAKVVLPEPEVPLTLTCLNRGPRRAPAGRRARRLRAPAARRRPRSVSYTHLTLPTN